MTTVVPQWLRKRLKDTDLEPIRAAITNAEKNTSGEIIVLLVRSSHSFSHVFWLAALLATVLALTGIIIFQQYPWLWAAWWSPFYLLGLPIIAFSFGLRALQSNVLKRLFTSRRDRMDQVHKRALLEFYTRNLHATNDQTGVLILVSFTEHCAVILGDKGINAKIAKGAWQEMITQLLQDTKRGDLARGLLAVIKSCGDVLSQHFPRQADDVNELPDHFYIVE